MGRKAFILFLAISLASACISSVEEDLSLKLSLDPVYIPHTKAEAFPSATELGVSAYAYSPSAKWSAGSAVLSDARTVLAGSTDGYWHPVATGTLPASGNLLALMAYAPYGSGSISTDGGVVWENVSMDEAGELLYSDLITGIDPASGAPVTLHMHPAASLLSFYFKAKPNGDERFSVTKIVLSGIAPEGSFRSLPGPAWTIVRNTKEIAFYEGWQMLDLDYNIVGEPVAIIPQLLSGVLSVTVEVSFNNWKESYTLEKKLPGILASPGRQVIISASLSDKDIALVADLLEKEEKEGGNG